MEGTSSVSPFSNRRKSERTPCKSKSCNVPDYVHTNRSQPRKGNICRDIPILGSQHLLHRLLHIAQISPTHEKRSRFGQRYAPLTIDDPEQPLRHSAPKINLETVTWTDDVVRSDRKIHRNRLRVIRAVAEDLQAKALGWPLASRCLHVHVIERWDVREGIGTVDHPHRRHIFFASSSPGSSRAHRLLPSALVFEHFSRASPLKRHGGNIPPERQSIDRALAQ